MFKIGDRVIARQNCAYPFGDDDSRYGTVLQIHSTECEYPIDVKFDSLEPLLCDDGFEIGYPCMEDELQKT